VKETTEPRWSARSSGADGLRGRDHLELLLFRKEPGDGLGEGLEVLLIGSANRLTGQPGGCRDLDVRDPGDPALWLGASAALGAAAGRRHRQHRPQLSGEQRRLPAQWQHLKRPRGEQLPEPDEQSGESGLDLGVQAKRDLLDRRSGQEDGFIRKRRLARKLEERVGRVQAGSDRGVPDSHLPDVSAAVGEDRLARFLGRGESLSAGPAQPRDGLAMPSNHSPAGTVAIRCLGAELG